MTLQVSNIAGDGRHVVKPREFPRHAEVYAPPDNWRGTKARKVYKEPDHNRIQYMELSYRRKEGRRDAPSHQHHRRRKTHGYAVWLPRRAQQTGGLREGHITGSRASGRRRDGARLQAANIARDGRHMEATQPGGRWTGLMKRSRACVVNPSLGVNFSPTSLGEDGCFVPPQVACARTE